MKCKKCNEQLSLFDKYCTNCGEKVTRFWENIKIKPIKMPKIKSPRFKITKEISLIIIALIFAGAYIIVENQKIDYKEKVRIEKEKEANTNEQLREACFNEAEANHILLWDKTCKSKGMKSDCSLQLDIAESIEKDYRVSRDECFKKYPVINP